MDFFKLPYTTTVQRVVPKNAFDTYTNSKQKKLFTDKILRITWTHKLSQETLNLESGEIKEIQIFRIELKVKDDISSVLDIIDKAIPYHIIFIVEYEGLIYLSTSKKHPHPTNDDNSVIDWTFKSEWFNAVEPKYTINLKQNIDAIFKDLCVQLSGRPDLVTKTMEAIVQNQQQVELLRKAIAKLETGIYKSQQFKEKVEMNLLLQQKRKELEWLLNNSN